MREKVNNIEKEAIQCGFCDVVGTSEKLETPLEIKTKDGRVNKILNYQCDNCGFQGNVHKEGVSKYITHNY